MEKKKKKFYVDNKKLYNDILVNYWPKVLEWKQMPPKMRGDPPPITDRMGEDIFKIAKGYCYSKSFYYLTRDHEDLASYACLIVIKYIHNFNPEKFTNPFAYITMLVHNAFLQFLKKESKNNKAKSAIVEKMYFEQMTSDNIEPDNFITYMQDRIDQEGMENKKLNDREKV